MVRPHLLAALGDLAHARTSLKVLEGAVLLEMERGYRPTFRGHEWGHEHFEAIERAHEALEAAWELLKWVQWPEMTSRLEAANQILPRQLNTKVDKR